MPIDMMVSIELVCSTISHFGMLALFSFLAAVLVFMVSPPRTHVWLYINMSVSGASIIAGYLALGKIIALVSRTGSADVYDSSVVAYAFVQGILFFASLFLWLVWASSSRFHVLKKESTS